MCFLYGDRLPQKWVVDTDNQECTASDSLQHDIAVSEKTSPGLEL